MTESIESVKTFLEKYGWKYDSLSEDIVVSGFAGEISTFTLLIKADEDWIILSISPFVASPRRNCYSKTITYLVRLNFHVTLVKFSVDENDNIVLTVELPANGLTYEAFVFSLEALCFYADDQHQKILNLATKSGMKLPSFPS